MFNDLSVEIATDKIIQKLSECNLGNINIQFSVRVPKYL